jgi:hypothetical protein
LTVKPHERIAGTMSRPGLLESILHSAPYTSDSTRVEAKEAAGVKRTRERTFTDDDEAEMSYEEYLRDSETRCRVAAPARPVT